MLSGIDGQDGEDGLLGPPGPPGPTGPTGPTGATGGGGGGTSTTILIANDYEAEDDQLIPYVDNLSRFSATTFTGTTGVFTTLTINTTISGTALTTYLASPAAIGGTTRANGAFALVGAGVATSAAAFIRVGAGTTAISPILLQAGTNLTAAAAGAFEYDGTNGYFTPVASQRGVIMAEQYTVLNAAYTLTSATAAQKLFNASTNGTLTLALGTYEFECAFSLSAMSAVNSIFGFAFGGTAVLTQAWDSVASNGSTSLSTATTPYQTFNTTANVALTGGTPTSQVGYAKITGIIRVTTAGTIIPSVSLNTAAAAVVAAGSYFKICQIGIQTATTVGNWS